MHAVLILLVPSAQLSLQSPFPKGVGSLARSNALRQLPLEAAEPRLCGHDWLLIRVASAAQGSISLTTRIASAPFRPSYDRMLLRYQMCAVSGPGGRFFLFDAVDLQCRGVMGKAGRGHLDVPLTELSGCGITEVSREAGNVLFYLIV